MNIVAKDNFERKLYDEKWVLCGLSQEDADAIVSILNKNDHQEIYYDVVGMDYNLKINNPHGQIHHIFDQDIEAITDAIDDYLSQLDGLWAHEGIKAQIESYLENRK